MITTQILNELKPDIRQLVLDNPIFFSKKPKTLLGVTNSKTIKGEKDGYLTGILYLSPADSVTKKTLCAYAEKAGCKNGCLYTAGRGKFNSVHMARVRKTIFYLFYRNEFMRVLANDIARLQRKANRDRLTLAIRLNGTSDIKWEYESLDPTHNFYYNIFETFPNIQFYDYTKSPIRKAPKNYHLTFSYSDRPEYAKVVAKSEAKNPTRNIAVVFNGELPTTYRNRTVINGDKTDLRFLDQDNVIVGLTAKGKAKQDTSGFVVNL